MSPTASAEPFSVAGQRIVVVGGTAGIGLAVANHLVSVGADVTITGRRPDGQAIAHGIGAAFHRMDVADGRSVAAAFEAIAEAGGRIDCLFLYAGIDVFHGEIDELDVATFERVFDVNTVGLVRALAQGIPLMGPGGSVIVTSSPAGSITAPGMAAYSASKAALDMLVRTWAHELGDRRIRVNAVLPGIVESEMEAGSTADLELIRRMTATGVVRRAAEMGPVFQFLASPASSSLTGSAVGAHDGLGVGYSREMIARLGADLATDLGTEPGVEKL